MEPQGHVYHHRPPRLYLIPLLGGLGLIGLGAAILIHPWLLRLLVALPFFLAGLGLVSAGLNLWRIWPRQWRSRVQIHSRRFWPGN